MVVIRLMRSGTKKKPFYRIVAIDKDKPRESAYIELLGQYDPKKQPLEVKIDLHKYENWMKLGARPSETVKSLVKKVSTDK